ncbi:MAG: hypothetical protein II098_01440 [Treponema sp.]|jgi:hypothetical protein|nr:hypothetical protein [Treponema sp.]MBQ5998807.1 hypothetical protein [Treponema sp.]
MKKLVAVIFSLFVALGGAFAQSQVSALPEDEIKVDLSVKEYTPENQHLDKDDRTGKVRIKYVPMVDEVRIYYTTMYETYDNGKAMNTVLGCLEDFLKENKYYHYKYMEKDRERYFKDSRGIRWAEYSSHVKFSR